MKKSENIGYKIFPLVFLLGILGLWDFVTLTERLPKYILPSPRDVFFTFFEIIEALSPHILVTLQEAMIGFVLAVIVAIILAVLMDHIKLVKMALYPILVISQTIPIIVLAPLFAIWFGFGILPKVMVVMMVCFFPIVISLMEGFEAVDQDQINLLRSMGASKGQIFKHVKFPAVMVSFFSGLKVAATYSVMGAFVGEWMGGTYGLGLYMLRAKKSFQLERVFVVIFIVVILSLSVFKLVSALQYVLMPWDRHKKNKRGKI